MLRSGAMMPLSIEEIDRLDKALDIVQIRIHDGGTMATGARSDFDRLRDRLQYLQFGLDADLPNRDGEEGA